MEKKNGSLIITGGRDCKIRVWEPRSVLYSKSSNEHTGWIFSIIPLDEKRNIASTGSDETIRIFNLQESQNGEDESEEEDGEDCEEEENGLRSSLNFQGHTNTVRCLASFPSHRLLISGSDDKKIKCWNIKKSKCVKTVKKMHRDSVKDVEPVGRTYFVSGSDDHTVLKWSLKKLRKPVRSLSLATFVSRLLYMKEKNSIFVGMSNIAAILDKDLRIQTKFVHERPITQMSLDMEHNRLITGDRKGYICMWDLRKPNSPSYFEKHHGDYITGIAVLNSEEYVTTSLQRPNSMKYWKFDNTDCTKEVNVDCDGIWSMCYIGERLMRDFSEQMKKDVEERVNWLMQSESDEDDDVISEKIKIQLFDRHMYVSKILLSI